MAVQVLLAALKNQAAAIGCVVVNVPAGHDLSHRALIVLADHPLAHERLGYGMFDFGVAKHIDASCLDKTRKNSTYYKTLCALQADFEAAKTRLQVFAAALQEVGQVFESHQQKVQAWDAAVKLTRQRLDALKKLH